MVISVLLLLAACAREPSQRPHEISRSYPVDKTNEQWKKELTPEQYRVLREKGTERAFTGALCHRRIMEQPRAWEVLVRSVRGRAL